VTDISERTTRKHLALGRVQAFADTRLDVTVKLASAVRSARACGATDEELRVETGLTRAELKRLLTRAPNTLGGGS